MRPMQYEILNNMNHYCLLNGAVSETVPVQHTKHAQKCLNESYLISLKISYHFISRLGLTVSLLLLLVSHYEETL